MDKNETVKRSYQNKPDPRREVEEASALKRRLASMRSVLDWEPVTEVDHAENERRASDLRRRLRAIEEGADQA